MGKDMRSFDIFVDSSANLTEKMIDDYDINVISYTCSIDGKEMLCYEKGVPFEETAKKFYNAMREGAETKTTLINAEKIINAVTPSLESERDVLMVTITTRLSGTYNQALEAQKQLKESFPDRKFIVVDSFNASLGEGLLAVYAAELGGEGKGVEECAQWIEDNKLNLNSYVTVSSLKYLKKGGRISSATAIVGTILNIKPVIWGSDKGILEVLCNERGRKKAINKLADMFKERVIDPENQHIAIAHADCEEEALELAEKIKEYGARDVTLNMYDLCTGAHIGPGTIALFFLGTKRGLESGTEKSGQGFFSGLKAKHKTQN